MQQQQRRGRAEDENEGSRLRRAGGEELDRKGASAGRERPDSVVDVSSPASRRAGLMGWRRNPSWSPPTLKGSGSTRHYLLGGTKGINRPTCLDPFQNNCQPAVEMENNL